MKLMSAAMTPKQKARLETKMQEYLCWIASLPCSPPPIRLRRILARYPRGIGIQSIRLYMRQSRTKCEALLRQWEQKGWVYLEFGVVTAEEEAKRRQQGQHVVRVAEPYRLWRWGPAAITVLYAAGEVEGEVISLVRSASKEMEN